MSECLKQKIMKKLFILTLEYVAGCESECMETVVLGIFEEDKLEEAKTFFANQPRISYYSDWSFETELFEVNTLTKRF
jgi:hypothetical protein